MIIKNLERFEQCELHIFNRWGDEVFNDTNYSNNWNGAGLSGGVYFYILKCKNINRFEYRKGTITLVD